MSSVEGLEQLDEVAGRVLEQDLLATFPRYDLIPEPGPLLLEPLNGSGQVVDLDLEAVPSPGLGTASVGHGGSSSAGSRRVQQEAKVPSHERGKARSRVHLHLEAEVRGVEAYRRVDVVDHVSNTDLAGRPVRSHVAVNIRHFPALQHMEVWQ